MDHKYIAWSLSLNLVDLIAKSLEKNVFEVNLYAGYCLCYVFCECVPDQFLQIIPQALPVLHELLSSTEPVSTINPFTPSSAGEPTHFSEFYIVLSAICV